MNKNLILKSDILDIIFERRNKAYGAYNLRKFYGNRLKLALGFMLVIATGFAAFTLLPDKARVALERIYNNPETILTQVDIKPPEAPKPPELPKPAVSALTPVNQKQVTNNIAVVDDVTKTNKINTIAPTDNIGTDNIDNAKTGPLLITPDKTETGAGAPEKTAPAIDKTSPMDADAVDVKPAYPGGNDALRKFLQKNLENPYDNENGETISVIVRFVVGYDGKLKQFIVVKDGGDIYNKEVLRVLKKMPDWIPGKARGENVSVYYNIPVRFIMSN